MPTPSGLVTRQELIDAQLDTAHLGRVVNSKDAAGNPISQSTNRTGGVNATLDALLGAIGLYSVGFWTDDPTLTEVNQYVRDNSTGLDYQPVTLPYTVNSALNPDPETLVTSGVLKRVNEVTQQDLIDQLGLLVGGSVYPGDDGAYVKNGDTVPSGTTHLIVQIGGVKSLVAISPAASGIVIGLTGTGATVGTTTVSFNPVGTKEFKHLYDTNNNLVVDGVVFLGDKVVVDNYYENGDSGQLFFRVVNSGTGVSDGGKYIDLPNSGLQLEQNLKKPYNIKAWGAKGDGDQTLLATNKTVDGGQVAVTQETHDGICRDNTLSYIKSVGGGELFIPSGEYRVYAYAPDLDFDVSIIGEGRDLSILKSCDSSPVQNGYGVLASYGNTKRHIKLIDFTIDGNVDVRGIGSVRAYNFAMYGDNLTVFSSNFSSINSPIDCWYSNVNPDSNNGVYAEGLFLDHSGRNTMSLVGAQNHVYVGCTVSGGGTAGSGINPRACLDVEPNDPAKTCRNIKFSSTTFKKAVNQLTISSWGEVDYDNCTFDAGTDNPNSGIPGREEYPWLFNSSNSQVTYDNCKFLKKDNYTGVGKIFNDNGQGEYVNTQIAKFSNCFGEGVGVHGIGFKGSFSDVELTNSLIPFLIDGTGTQEVEINNLTLVNVLDGTNFGAGSEASFAIKNRTEGDVYIDGLKVLIKPDKFPSSNFDTGNIVRHRGVSLDASGATDTTWRIRNVHSDGYYRLLPNKLGLPINASNFRDWGFPNQPPADDTSNTINPGAPSYKDCTMRGDQ